MGLFPKSPRRDEPVPPWAEFMEGDEYQTFVDLVRDDFDRRAMPYALDLDDGAVHLTEPGREGQSLGLVTMAQVCRQAQRKDWREIVTTHFDRMLRAVGDEGPSLDHLIIDFPEARKLLKVRLFPAGVAGQDFLTHQEPIEGIISVLVYDLPDQVVSVHEDHVEAWSRPPDELFAIGLANVKAGDPVEPQHFELEPGGPSLIVLTGESLFTATHVLFLGDYLPPDLPNGALVAIPHRHTAVCHPITDATVIAALKTMVPMAVGMHREGPGSVSPNLYWWRDGQFTLLPAEIRDANIDFRPPEEFVEMLNRVVS